MVEIKGQRQFKSLRVSLTGECNLACTYCVPEQRCIKEPDYEFSGDELIRVIGWIREITGLEKVRLTGGEPLISPKFDNVLKAITEMPLNDVSITTNGQILEEKLPLIHDCGIKRLNVSLDTLDSDRFRRITRGGVLQKTLTGIEGALDRKIALKINMVPVKNVNEDEILPLLDYCLDRNMELRYIELMQMGHLSDRAKFERKFFPLQQIFDMIRQKYEFEPVPTPLDSTSKRYVIKNRGYFGVIANDSEPFCAHCNRLRLTSDGFIHGCLSSKQSFSIVHLLNLPDEKATRELKNTLALAMRTKRDYSFKGSSTQMQKVGG